MIRLLTIRAEIAAWKRAISVSDRLSPVTWKYLAATLAVLSVLSLWGFQKSPKHSRRSLETQEVGRTTSYYYSPKGLSSGSSYNCYISLEGMSRSTTLSMWTVITTGSVDPGNGNVMFTTSPRTSRGIENWRLTEGNRATFSPGMIEQAFSIDGGFRYNHRTARYVNVPILLEESGFTVADEWFNLPRLPKFGPNVVLQLSAPGNQSLFDGLQKLMLLFQAVVFTIGSIFASVFGWIGYHRGKAEMKLKQLQIRKLELEIEQMERDADRARREAANSGLIVVVS